MKSLVLKLLTTELKASTYSRAISTPWHCYGDRDTDYARNNPSKMTGVHLAAYFGLTEIMVALAENGLAPNSRDTYGRTPLRVAVGNGQVLNYFACVRAKQQLKTCVPISAMLMSL